LFLKNQARDKRNFGKMDCLANPTATVRSVTGCSFAARKPHSQAFKSSPFQVGKKTQNRDGSFEKPTEYSVLPLGQGWGPVRGPAGRPDRRLIG
jgi:hypothetical protein